MYLQYIDISNKIVNCHEHIAHPQKRQFIRQMSEACIGRILELKHELVDLECSDFQFFVPMLLRLKLFPKDMEVKIPEYYRDRTDAENECREIVEKYLKIQSKQDEGKIIVTENKKKVKLATAYIQIIQSHERARQEREEFRDRYKRYIAKEITEQRQSRAAEQVKKSRQEAAIIIQRAWVKHRIRKSLKEGFERLKIDTKYLRRLPRPKKFFEDEVEKDRFDVIKRYQSEYEEAKRAVERKLDLNKIDEKEKELEAKILAFFDSFDSRNLPEFPSDEDGGSSKMFELSADLDDGGQAKEKSDKESQGSKGVKSTKDTKSAKETKGKDDKKNEAAAYCLKSSNFLDKLTTLQEEYRRVWHVKRPNFEKFDSEMLEDEINKKVERSVRLKVDQKMRLELEKRKKGKSEKGVKSKAKEEKKGKKMEKKGKKQETKEKDLTPDKTLESLVQELVSQHIIVSQPKYNLCDFIGDFNLRGPLQHMTRDPAMDFTPCLGDVRKVIREYCILPMGSEFIHCNAPLVKSLLIVGPKGVGKKSLVYAVCNEIGAVMMDLSAENIEGKYPGKEGKAMLIHLISKVGRLLQPTVIFIKDAENYFYKTKPAYCKLSEPGRLKTEFQRFVKSIRNEDRVMVIGTADLPFHAEVKDITMGYNKIICILRPDYNCRRSLWREMIVKNKGIITENLDMTNLCNISEGYAAGSIECATKQVLTSRRLAYQKKIPLEAADFYDGLAAQIPVYEEENEAYKQFMSKMTLNKKRALLLQSEGRGEEEDVSDEED